MFEKQYKSWQKKLEKSNTVTNHVWKAVPKLTKNYLNKAIQLPIMFEKQYKSWLKITWKKQ